MEKFNVLIADDHQLFREGIESLLKKLPQVGLIFHAQSGKEVLALLDEQSVGLIFMDIRMPDGNGLETTSLIRKSNDKIKIIALTMMEDSYNVVNMFRAGINGYLLKNTSFNELKEAIEKVMNSERYYSKEISQIIFDRIICGQHTKAQKSGTQLTGRELEIIGLVCRGFTNKDIGELLHISVKTVETHRSHIYEKLNISNAAELAVYAMQEGIVARNQ